VSNPSTHQPKYLQIAEDLDEQMRRGDYKPGDPLPPKPVLMETYGAALGTVDKALSWLRHRGLIESVQGRGTFVLPRPAPEPTLAEQIAALKARLDEQNEELTEMRRRLDSLEAQMVEARANLGLPDASVHTIEEAG